MGKVQTSSGTISIAHSKDHPQHFQQKMKWFEKHAAKQNLEEPCAVVSARTDLWELRASNRPEPPGQIPPRFH